MRTIAFVRIGIITLLLCATIAHGAKGQDEPPPLVRVGKYHVEDYRVFRRLLHDGVLWGSQINRQYITRYDVPNALGCFSPWDVLALEGSLVVWDPRLEPLSYYHRTGPVGAIFHELRSRKNGADAKAPIGGIGLSSGTTACYALSGQKITYYETHPELKKLVVDTDRYFTFIGDARQRGATVEIKIGNARKNLEQDAEQKFAVLLVELYDTGFDPGDRLTLEAVKLYMDRVTADGIVAIHISNKYFRLEPVIAAIAKELRLSARVWHDDGESQPGKTASSWVVLAEDEKSLGVLAKTTKAQVLEYGTKNLELIKLLNKYGSEADAKDAIRREWGGDGVSIETIETRHGPQVSVLVEYVRKAESSKQELNLEDLTELAYGPMFHPIKLEGKIGVRRDGDKAWPPGVVILPNWLEKLIGP